MKKPVPQTTREQWQTHISVWKSSGGSQAAYCRTHNLIPHVFRYWKDRVFKVRVSAHPTPALPPALVPVTVTDEPASIGTPQSVPLPLQPTLSAISVYIDNRHRIDLMPGFDPTTLHQIVAVLRS